MPSNSVQVELSANITRFEAAMKSVVSTIQKVKVHMETLSSFAKKVALVGGGALAIAVKEASAAEQAFQRLSSILEASGLSIEVWGKKLKSSAAEIQNLTVFGDDEVIQLFTFATALGVSANRLDEVTRKAIGLSKAVGVDQQAAIRAVVLTMNGQFQLLSRYLPELREDISDTEKLNKVNELAARGWKIATGETNTFRGALSQLKNAVGDLNEEIGFTFLNSLTQTVKNITAIVPKIGEWIKEHKNLTVTIIASTTAITGLLIFLPRIVTVIGLLVKALFTLYTTLALVSSNVGKLVVAFAFMQNPAVLSFIGAFILALGSLIFAMKRLSETMFSFDESDVVGAIKAIIPATLQATNGLNQLTLARRRLAEANTNDQKLAALREGISGIDKAIAEEQATQPGFSNRNVFSEQQGTQALQTSEKRIARLQSMRAELENQINAVHDAIIAGTADNTKVIDENMDLAKSINETISKLREESDTFGLTGEQAALLKIQMQGATEAQIAEAQAIVNSIQAKRDAAKADEDRIAADEKMMNIVQRIANETAILRGDFTADQIEIFDLRNLGISEGRIEHILSLLKQRQALATDKELEKEGQILAENVRTNKEKLSDELKHIEMLQAANKISDETAERAKRAATERLTESQKVFQSSIVGLSDLFSRIQIGAAQPRSKEDIILQSSKQTATSTAQTVTELKNTNKVLKEILNKEEPVATARFQ